MKRDLLSFSLIPFVCAFAMTLSSQAQSADDPAAKKSVEQIRNVGASLGQRNYTVGGIVAQGNKPISIGISESRDPALRRTEVKLTEFELDQRTIDSQTWQAIDTFLQNEVYSISLPRKPLRCAERGEQAAIGRGAPCIEVRFEFNAEFRNPHKFTRPETGEFWPGGTCSIFVTLRTREASIWCYGSKHGMIVNID